MLLYSEKDRKITAAISILSGILGLACLVVGLVATQYDSEAFANPVKLLEMTGVDAHLIRWFMLLDMFGYYLLLLPLVFYINHKLETKTIWASLLTSLAFGYIIVGAIGAVVLSVVWPSIIEKYNLAGTILQEIYRADFLFVTDFVVKGLWNYLEVLLGGIWWLGVGAFAVNNRPLKITTIVLGMACITDSIGEILKFPILAEIGLNIYLVLGIVWPIWVGLSIWKNKF